MRKPRLVTPAPMELTVERISLSVSPLLIIK